MNPQEKIEAFLEQIRTCRDECEVLFGQDPLRYKQVENSLPVAIQSSYDGLTPNKFIIKLVNDLLSALPDQHALDDFAGTIKHLAPFGEIKKIVCSKEFDGVIKIKSQDVINDHRLPLAEFQRKVCEYLSRNKKADRK